MKSTQSITFFRDDDIVGLDGEARDMHAHWLEDDELEGVAKRLSTNVDVVRSMLYAIKGCRQHSMHVGYAQRSMTCASLGGEVVGRNHHSTGSASYAYSYTVHPL